MQSTVPIDAPKILISTPSRGGACPIAFCARGTIADVGTERNARRKDQSPGRPLFTLRCGAAAARDEADPLHAHSGRRRPPWEVATKAQPDKPAVLEMAALSRRPVVGAPSEVCS